MLFLFCKTKKPSEKLHGFYVEFEEFFFLQNKFVKTSKQVKSSKKN